MKTQTMQHILGKSIKVFMMKTLSLCKLVSVLTILAFCQGAFAASVDYRVQITGDGTLNSHAHFDSILPCPGTTQNCGLSGTAVVAQTAGQNVLPGEALNLIVSLNSDQALTSCSINLTTSSNCQVQQSSFSCPTGVKTGQIATTLLVTSPSPTNCTISGLAKAKSASGEIDSIYTITNLNVAVDKRNLSVTTTQNSTQQVYTNQAWSYQVKDQKGVTINAPVNIINNSPTICDVTQGNIYAKNQGSCSFKLSINASSSYEAYTMPGNAVITIKAITPTISLSVNKNSMYVGNSAQATVAVSPTVPGQAIQYSTSSSTCSVNQTTGVIIATSAGNCRVEAYVSSSDSNYLSTWALPKDITILANPSITLNCPSSLTINSAGYCNASVSDPIYTPIITYSASGACSVNSSSGLVTAASTTGTCSVSAIDNGNGIVMSKNITINKMIPTLTLSGIPTSLSYGDSAVVHAATTPALSVQYSSPMCGNITQNGMDATITANIIGACTYNVTVVGNSSYDSITQSFTVNINKAVPTIYNTQYLLSMTFGDTLVLDMSQTKVLDTKGNPTGQQITFSTDPTICAVDAAGVITAVKAGNCKITPIAVGNSYYYSVAGAPITVQILKMNTTATVTAPSQATVGDIFSSNVTVSHNYWSNINIDATPAAVCKVAGRGEDGADIEAVGYGVCTITAQVSASDSTNASDPVSVAVQIERRQADIKWDKYPSPLTAETPDRQLLAHGDSAGVTTTQEITYTVDTPNVCGLFNQEVYLINAELGACVVTATATENNQYQSATSTISIATAKLAPNIGIKLPKTQIFVGESMETNGYGEEILSYTVSGTCSYIVGSYTPPSLEITGTAEGTCSINYAFAGDERYLAWSDERTVSVVKRPQIINAFLSATEVAVGEAFTATTNVVEGVNTVPDISIASGGCSIEGIDGNTAQIRANAAGNCTVRFANAGNEMYSDWMQDLMITVVKAQQTITVNNLPEFFTKDIDVEISASASSGLSVDMSVSGNCIQVGSAVRPTQSGMCKLTFTQSGDNNYYPAQEEYELPVRGPQEITVTSVQTTGLFESIISTSAVTDSGLPVHISVDGDFCQLNPEPAEGDDQYVLSTASIKLVAIGSCKITYSQPGGDVNGVWFGPADSKTRIVAVQKWPQTINVTREPGQTAQAGTIVRIDAVSVPTDEEFRKVKFSVSNSSACAVDKEFDTYAEIKLDTTGESCTIYMNQAGDAKYAAAPQISRTVILSLITTGKDINNYWHANKLFTTGTAAGSVQPIMSPPMVARDGSIKAQWPNVMVVFGTGKYHEVSDVSNKAIQTLYGVHDIGVYNLTRYQNGGTKFVKRMFTEQTFTSGTKTQTNRKVSGDVVDWSKQYGWYIDLATDGNKNGSIESSEMLGERSVFRPFLANRLYVFNTVQPIMQSCDGATKGWTMLIDWTSGLAPEFATYDANMDGKFDSNDVGFVGYFNETAASELGRGGNSIYDTSGSEARRREVTFGVGEVGVRLGWEEKQPYGILKRTDNP